VTGRGDGPDAAAPLPRRPYRDTLLLHGALALAIVLLSAATGGDLVRAAAIAGAYFVGATAWSWLRFWQRARAAATAGDRREQPKEGG
jgi:hypothetical protein